MTNPSPTELAQYVNHTRARSTAARIGRRTLLRAAATGGLGLTGAAALTACGVRGHVVPAGAQEKGQAGKDYSATEKKVVFATWPSYIDVDPKNPNRRPTLEAFEKQTGIQVQYLEVINDNNDWYTKIDPSLVKGIDTGYDLMVVSDYMVGKYRAYDYIQELDLTNIPNHSLLLPRVIKDPTDPGRRFSIPWAYGYTTFAYNTNLVKQPITSLAEVFTRPDLHGKVSLFSEMEDTVAIALLALGHDPEHFTDAQFNQALEYVRRAKDRGQIRSFTGNDYLSDFQQGNTAVTMAYSGDVAQLGKPNLVTLDLPKEGMLSWSDNCVIPNFARHKTNAEKLLNYYLQPQVAAALDDFINYIPSVRGAEDELRKLDSTAAAVPLIVPTQAMQDKARGFMAVSIAQLNDYTNRFQQVTGQ
ncbi:PotD/PotF family extracellular solute-binding protein [Streptantibioticus rubrisoli]|uniref:Spermidine/putrescine ABC transporter substrate-binding protein n=1 Tax=Streptantibioticus rubrisoli TaxID=1387313 RepID=A0ABT1PE52_9ACTN|nr:spermidine/putrescine ABC transporter substrate-binding protein [Streptantibioticus rubrisoli]MCQ4043639.1 spermidine/putrescine ABC transporter substrate-binding protein [Streptantibioticus rubrisoli]